MSSSLIQLPHLWARALCHFLFRGVARLGVTGQFWAWLACLPGRLWRALLCDASQDDQSINLPQTMNTIIVILFFYQVNWHGWFHGCVWWAWACELF